MDTFYLALKQHEAKRAELAKAGEIGMRAISELSRQLDDVSSNRFKVGGRTWILPKCWNLTDPDDENPYPELRVNLGLTRCSEKSIHLEEDRDGVLKAWLEDIELWCKPALGIVARFTQSSPSKQMIKLEIETRRSLLDLKSSDLTVWKIEKKSTKPARLPSGKLPKEIRYPQSARVEKLANLVAKGGAHLQELERLVAQGELAPNALSKLRGKIESLANAHRNLEVDLELTKKEQLLQVLYEAIRKRLYWTAVEMPDYRKERPALPNARREVRTADSVDTAFEMICEYVIIYLESGRAKVDTESRGTTPNWEILLEEEFQKHARHIDQELDRFDGLTVEEKVADLMGEAPTFRLSTSQY